MAVHRLTCDTLEDHMARMLAERDRIPESLVTFTELAIREFDAEMRLLEQRDPISAYKGWTEAELREAWGA